MKTLLVAVNSKYIHSSLAVWYLKSYCSRDIKQASGVTGPGEAIRLEVAEYTINDNLESVLGSIYLKKPDVICFSCYIWNIEYILKLAGNIKKLIPGCIIVLGGPEVSYDAEKIMEEEPSVDFIISGEGEETLRSLLILLSNSLTKNLNEGLDNNSNENKCGYLQRIGSIGIDSFEKIRGLTYRVNGEIRSTEPCALIEKLDEIPSPYTEDFFNSLKNRIVYFESSRGCPFNCSYCLSSTIAGVRYFSLERVKKDISELIKRNVKQVKFVDRTFNANKRRAKEIFKFIIEETAGTKTDINFHFEMGGDLFDEEMFDILSDAPPGLIQFEIGVQTTNQNTLREIDRVTDFQKLKTNIQRLRSLNNIHIHLDLIAGLPCENYDSFIRSFNDVYALNPHQLQLGFLKMLKGSKIRRQSGIHEYKFRDYPPYEVLSNKYISYDQMLILKEVEELIERYYNSGRFSFTLDFLTSLYKNPYDFYYRFSRYYEACGYYENIAGAKELYRILYEFIESELSMNPGFAAYDPGSNSPGTSMLLFLKNMLRLDFLKCDNAGRLPEILKCETPKGFKDDCFQFLREENIKRYLPDFTGMAAKDIIKKVHFQLFDYDVANWQKYPRGEKTEPEMIVVLFDYEKRDRVTGWFFFTKVDTKHFPSLYPLTRK